VLIRNGHEKLRANRVSMKTAFLLILLCSLTLLTVIGALDKFVATSDAKESRADYSRKLDSSSYTAIWVLDNSSIQEAINKADPGDTIYVGAGVYHEDIVVNKSLFLVGENAVTTVLDGEGESLLILRVVASDVTVRNFTVKNTRADRPAYGVSIKDSQNVSLMNVTVGQSYTGLVLDSSSNCEIVNNAFIDNYAYGVDLRDNSVNNTIVSNWIVANPTGMLIWDETCENNRFHHNNFVNNTNQIDVKYGGPNMWDDGNEGNYWSDYTGLDDGSDGRVAEDGVGDTLLPHQNVDYYPLMSEESLGPAPPVARFSISSGPLFVNVDITFDPSDSIDPDGNIMGYYWDFGDGTNKTRVNKPGDDTIEHSYANTGSYTVSLTVTDDDRLNASIAKVLTVQKMNTSIHITVVPSEVTVGYNVTVSGDITPRTVGLSVTIYYMFIWSSPSWKELATVPTDFYGNYTYAWPITQAGNIVLKANWTGNEEFLCAESKIESVTVEKVLSSITIDVEPQNVTVGSNVTICGTINPMREDVNVSVQISRTNETGIVFNATVKTDAGGSYAYVWKTSEAGTWEIRVSWEGDQNAKPAESKAKVNVEATPPSAPQNLLPYVAAAIIIIIALSVIYFLIRKH
jgi:PKD repeat protein